MSKAVLFDFGNVLYRFDYELFFNAVAVDGGGEVSYMREILFGPDAALAERFETGHMTRRQFFTEFRRQSGVTLSETEIEKRFVPIFAPNQPMIDFARTLAPRTPIGLISNTNEVHFESFIREIPIFSLFSVVVLSYVVGTMKPGREIFESATEELGLAPEECVFIDDLEDNVSAAASLGFKAVHYRFDMDIPSIIATL